MLYMKTDEKGSLHRVCKNCSFSRTEEVDTGRAIRVARTIYSEDELLYNQHQNKFLRFDPTLPRITDPSIKCPNPNCIESKERSQIAYIKYHPIDMKYLYVCDFCGYTWRLGVPNVDQHNQFSDMPKNEESVAKTN
jgi:hypothetical protein